ncbi:hypothetical protein VTI74DRAFT_3443 [Chaetomium olivicolor]
MHTTTLLAALMSLTGLTVALTNPAPVPFPEITPAPPPNLFAARPGANLARRDGIPGLTVSITDPKILSCSRAIQSLEDSMPTMTGPVRTWINNAMPVVDIRTLNDRVVTSVCDVQATLTPPASLASAFSEYDRASSSWVSAKVSEIRSLQGQCGSAYSAALGLVVVTDGESCTSAMQGVVDVYKGKSTNGGKQNAAAVAGPRETGMARMVVGVAVGVAGVVAAL